MLNHAYRTSIFSHQVWQLHSIPINYYWNYLSNSPWAIWSAPPRLSPWDATLSPTDVSRGRTASARQSRWPQSERELSQKNFGNCRRQKKYYAETKVAHRPCKMALLCDLCLLQEMPKIISCAGWPTLVSSVTPVCTTSERSSVRSSGRGSLSRFVLN